MAEDRIGVSLEQLNQTKKILSYFNTSQIIFHPPATGEMISQAQKVLDLTFPVGLINLLFAANGISVISEEFLGLSKELYIPNMLDVTLWARYKYKSFPHEYAVFFIDGFDNFYCINTSLIKNGEAPVVYWDAQEGLTTGVYASGVFKFVEMMSLLMTSMYKPSGDPVSADKLNSVTGFESFEWIKKNDPDIDAFRSE
jgi:hypothetical protein